MSIIYDALKKAEKTRQPDPKNIPKETRQPKITSMLVYALVATLGVVIAHFTFVIISKNSSPSKQETVKPAVLEKEPVKPSKTALPPKNEQILRQPPAKAAQEQKTPEQPKPGTPEFVLNGLFFSDNESYALINNEIIKEGQTINKAVLKRITLQGAELELDGKTIRLENTK